MVAAGFHTLTRHLYIPVHRAKTGGAAFAGAVRSYSFVHSLCSRCPLRQFFIVLSILR